MIPAFDNFDRIPDDRAVWREGLPGEGVEGFRQVCVDYGHGEIERTTVAQAKWSGVVRFRFGWPPA